MGGVGRLLIPDGEERLEISLRIELELLAVLGSLDSVAAGEGVGWVRDGLGRGVITDQQSTAA